MTQPASFKMSYRAVFHEPRGAVLNSWGGLGATFIRAIRRLGFDDQGIWGLGVSTRWFFLLVASLWERIPEKLRRRLPLQVIRFHSVRLHHWRLAERGFAGLSGLMSRSRLLVVDSNGSLSFPRRAVEDGFVAYMTKPQGRPIRWDIEGLRNARVVVSGGHDSTFPYQWDSRYAQTSPAEAEALIQSVRESGISRWYAENLTSYEPLFSPIPGGILPSPWRDSVRFVRSRPKRVPPKKMVFCAHRDKGGQRANPQFDVRRHVTALAEGPWEAFASIPEDYLSIAEFRRELRAHPFTLCVEGGGIDPSPKAFEALIQGSIPIIRESPLADAYRHFPVLVVSDWAAEALTEDVLVAQLAAVNRNWPDWFEVVQRLRLKYWANLVERESDTRRFARA